MGAVPHLLYHYEEHFISSYFYGSYPQHKEVILLSENELPLVVVMCVGVKCKAGISTFQVQANTRSNVLFLFR